MKVSCLKRWRKLQTKRQRRFTRKRKRPVTKVSGKTNLSSVCQNLTFHSEGSLYICILQYHSLVLNSLVCMVVQSVCSCYLKATLVVVFLFIAIFFLYVFTRTVLFLFWGVWIVCDNNVTRAA